MNTAVDPGIQSASTDEFMAGLARELGNKGSVRVDFLYRKFGDIYGNFLDMSTGVVTDPRTGRQFNLTVVNNTDSVERDYKGLSVQASYRGLKNLQLSGNYSLSFSRGSIEGENVTDIVVRASADEYPSTAQASWNYPIGYLNGDQRHKVRIWGTYDTPLPAAAGTLALGFMQRYDSGLRLRPQHVDRLQALRHESGLPHAALDRDVLRQRPRRVPVRRHRGGPTCRCRGTADARTGPTAQVFFRFVVNNVFNNQPRRRLQHDDHQPDRRFDARGVQPVHGDAGRRRALEEGTELRAADQPEQLPESARLQRLGRGFRF